MNRVLVIDDNDDIRLLLRAALVSDGADVFVASGGREALDILGRGEVFDLLLLDIQMPDMDGWDTLRAIRGAGFDVPVVLCTVKSQSVDAQRGWELGCDGYVAKPFDVEQLLGLVSDVLSRSADERVARRKAKITALASEV